MGWFRKVKKDEEKPRPQHSITIWNRCDGSIVSKQLDIIPRVGEKVMLGSIFDHSSKFLEVTHVYHVIGDNNIIIVLNEPP